VVGFSAGGAVVIVPPPRVTGWQLAVMIVDNRPGALLAALWLTLFDKARQDGMTLLLIPQAC
jgi:hypothetical protein